MRRRLLPTLAAALVLLGLVGCGRSPSGGASQGGGSNPDHPSDQSATGDQTTTDGTGGAGIALAIAPAQTPPTTSSSVSPPILPPITPPQPGPARVLRHVDGVTDKVALTFDDGFCTECIGNMVADLERTGAHVTFCPNGAYHRAYAPYVDRIKALIAKGQLAICNHTWDHPNITRLGPAPIQDEIARNDRWIQDTFGITARPYFRPPGGAHNRSTDAIAGQLGYTTVLLWSSTLSDSVLQTPETILQQLQANLVPGGIVLGHLNYLTTGQIFDQLLAVLAQRGLTSVTVPELVAAGASA